MPLVFKPVPSRIEQTIKKRLEKMSSKKAYSTPRLKKAILKEPEILPTPTQAMPVYILGLKNLAEKGDIKSAELKSWRYLIKQKEEVVATADAIFDRNNNPVFSHTNEGPLVQGVVKAIDTANSDNKITKGQYEIRILMIPAIHVVALWLVDLENKEDIAIPIEPNPKPIIPNEVIPIDKLMKTVQEIAKLSLSAYKRDPTLVG